MLVKYLLPCIFVVVLLSCQKQADEPLPPVESELEEAAFSIKSLAVFGAYFNDSALTDEHHLTLLLHISAPGSFTVNTEDVNGFGYRAAGTLKDTGTVELVVPAAGKPQQTGKWNFLLTYNGQAYAFQVDVTEKVPGEEELVRGPVGSLAVQANTMGVLGQIQQLMHYQPGTKCIRRMTSNYYPTVEITYNAQQKIDQVTYVYQGSPGDFYQFVYDEKGRVSTIMTMGADDQFSITHREFTYNADGTLRERRDYPNYLPVEYFYTDGNLTRRVFPSDTVEIHYDNRANHFNDVYPQFYFLDQMTLFDARDLSDMLYFSKNYPVSFQGKPVLVMVDALGRPTEVYVEGELLFIYGYNQ